MGHFFVCHKVVSVEEKKENDRWTYIELILGKHFSSNRIKYGCHLDGAFVYQVEVHLISSTIATKLILGL